jgi:hypothetical protein
MGGDEEPGEPDKYILDTPRPTVLEDLGAGAVSPEAALSKMVTPAPCTTKFYGRFSVLSPSQGPASTPSMLVTPCGAPPAPGTSLADAATGCCWWS